jgi:uncharacterized protein
MTYLTTFSVGTSSNCACHWARRPSALAINNGTSIQRGPSNFITATAGVGITAPALATYTLAAGADGATTITATVEVGVDTVPRKGMYSLRGQGCSIAILADADDSNTIRISSGMSCVMTVAWVSLRHA